MTVGNDSMFEDLVEDFSQVEKDKNKSVDEQEGANPLPPEDSSWYPVAKAFDIGTLDLDALADRLGYRDFEDLNISISPHSLLQRNREQFIGAVQASSLKAEDMSDEKIEALIVGGRNESKIKEIEKIETPFSPNESLLDQTIGEFRKIEDDPNKNVDEGVEIVTPPQCVTPFEVVLESCQQVTESSDLVDIANSRLGWSVAEQLRKILDNPSSHGIDGAELNHNAIRMIYGFVRNRKDEESLIAKEAIEDFVEDGFGDPNILGEAVEEEVTDEKCGDEKVVEEETIEEEATDEACDKKYEVEEEVVEEAEVEEELKSSDRNIYIQPVLLGDGWEVVCTGVSSNQSTVVFTFDTSEEAVEAGEKIAAAIGGEFSGDVDPRRADTDSEPEGFESKHEETRRMEMEKEVDDEETPAEEELSDSWESFAEKFGINKVELNTFAIQMGYTGRKEMENSISPNELKAKDSEKFEDVLSDFVGSDESVEEEVAEDTKVEEEVVEEEVKEDAVGEEVKNW